MGFNDKLIKSKKEKNKKKRKIAEIKDNDAAVAPTPSASIVDAVTEGLSQDFEKNVYGTIIKKDGIVILGDETKEIMQHVEDQSAEADFQKQALLAKAEKLADVAKVFKKVQPKNENRFARCCSCFPFFSRSRHKKSDRVDEERRALLTK